MNVGKAISRAFTPGGGEDPVAVQQREAAQAAKVEAAKAPPLPKAPAPPKSPMSFDPGQAPASRQRAAVTGTSILGAAATAGQTAKRTATVLG